MSDKMLFGLISMGIVGLIQIVAFLTGHNGAVFNFTTLIIGGIVGSALGFSINLNGSLKKFSKDQHKLNEELQKTFKDSQK